MPCCHYQSEEQKNTVCCVSPLFQVWSCRVAEMFWLLSLPDLLASVTAWNSRAPSKYSGWWPQQSEQNANFHAFEVNQAPPGSRLYTLPGHLPPWQQKQPVCHRSCPRKDLWVAIFHTINALFTPRKHSWQPWVCIRGFGEKPEHLLSRRKWKVTTGTLLIALQGTTTNLCVYQSHASDCTRAPDKWRDFCIAPLQWD